MGGRTTTAADGALQTSIESVIKSAGYAGWADFKGGLNTAWEDRVAQYHAMGHPIKDAQSLAAESLGYRRKLENAMQRTSDNVLILRTRGSNYVFDFDDQSTVEAIKKNTVEDVPAILKPIRFGSRIFSRLVTQFMPLFGPVNSIRDLWEKSELVRTRKLIDANGQPINGNAVARTALANAVMPETWKASFSKAFGTTLKNQTQARSDLDDMIELGGASTWGDHFQRQFDEQVADLKKDSRFDQKLWKKIEYVVEGYNNGFEMISSLSHYRAMLDQGMTKKDAAAATLDLTNFRKQGEYMGPIKALYVFAGPAAIGAQNLTQQLSTKSGIIRFVAYTAVMAMLANLFREMDDRDEAGRKKVDTLGSWQSERAILIPIGNGEYAKIPIGFGMPMLALGIAVNGLKFANGETGAGDTSAEIGKNLLKTLSPVQPNEISFGKYPGTYLAQAIAPTLIKPLVYVSTGRNAFGGKIEPEFPNKEKLAADQGRPGTPQIYKDAATFLQRTLGINAYPEAVKTISDGYIVGPIRYLANAEQNAQNEKIGRATNPNLFAPFIAKASSAKISTDAREKSDEYRDIINEQKSRKAHGEEPMSLTDQQKKEMPVFEKYDAAARKLVAASAQITKKANASKMEATAVDLQRRILQEKRDKLNAQFLRDIRTIEGKPTQ